MTWLLCDYGEVLCLCQPESDRTALAAESGIQVAEFWRRYWLERAPYDGGDLDDAAYWSRVLGHVATDEQVTKLVALDVASWLHPNQESLDAVALARERGYRLALLSNAPVAVARALTAVPWLVGFELRLFSCDLHLVKPDPTIYRETLHRLGASPSDVVFFDDRPDNIAAAQSLGIRAQLFQHPTQIAELPAVHQQ